MRPESGAVLCAWEALGLSFAAHVLMLALLVGLMFVLGLGVVFKAGLVVIGLLIL